LFKNLIENAAKFRKREGKAAINIRSEELAKDEQSHLKLPAGERYYKITVEDNGIGFDQQWAQKIFEPFVRLHGKSEFPGNGLGLAISKRIAENHKGIIYAESQKDIGSRFIVILPQTP
jgi:signal transduction histidine kinase